MYVIVIGEEEFELIPEGFCSESGCPDCERFVEQNNVQYGQGDRGSLVPMCSCNSVSEGARHRLTDVCINRDHFVDDRTVGIYGYPGRTRRLSDAEYYGVMRPAP